MPPRWAVSFPRLPGFPEGDKGPPEVVAGAKTLSRFGVTSVPCRSCVLAGSSPEPCGAAMPSYGLPANFVQGLEGRAGMHLCLKGETCLFEGGNCNVGVQC